MFPTHPLCAPLLWSPCMLRAEAARFLRNEVDGVQGNTISWVVSQPGYKSAHSGTTVVSTGTGEGELGSKAESEREAKGAGYAAGSFSTFSVRGTNIKTQSGSTNQNCQGQCGKITLGVGGNATSDNSANPATVRPNGSGLLRQACHKAAVPPHGCLRIVPAAPSLTCPAALFLAVLQ